MIRPSTNDADAVVPAPLFSAVDVTCGYGDLPVLRGLNLHVDAGEVVVLLGANGAGKTTTLLTIAGELQPSGGEIRLGGVPVRTSLHKRFRQGVCFIPEERPVIAQLSTHDNLRLGPGAPDLTYDMFPPLRPLKNRMAGLLSGGEQQMLAIGRALAASPKLLLADEISLGLAPMIVAEILDRLKMAAHESGAGVLLVEQHVRNALRSADRGYVLRRGAVVMEGTGEHLLERVEEIESTYMTAVL